MLRGFYSVGDLHTTEHSYKVRGQSFKTGWKFLHSDEEMDGRNYLALGGGGQIFRYV